MDATKIVLMILSSIGGLAIAYFLISFIISKVGKKNLKTIVETADGVLSTASKILQKIDTDPSKDNKLETIVKLGHIGVKYADQIMKDNDIEDKDELNKKKKEEAVSFSKQLYKLINSKKDLSQEDESIIEKMVEVAVKMKKDAMDIKNDLISNNTGNAKKKDSN